MDLLKEVRIKLLAVVRQYGVQDSIIKLPMESKSLSDLHRCGNLEWYRADQRYETIDYY